MKRISVIVPVYNVENYIKVCLDSILGQSYKNIEVIIVDDGSTDTGYGICKEYEQSDNRIVFLSGENHGVSNARNRALDVATGDYVLFVDSDDFLEKEALERYVLLSDQADMTVTAFQSVNEEGQIIQKTNHFDQKIIGQEDMLRFIFELTPQMGYQGYLWNKIFRNDVIQEYHLRFDESIKYNEDRLFIASYLLKIQSICLVPIITYSYRMRSDSAMSMVRNPQHYSSKVLTEFDAFKKILELLKGSDSTSYAYAAKAAYYRSYYILSSIPKDNHNDRDTVISMKNEFYQECIESDSLTFKKKMKLFIYQNLLSWIR